MQLSSRKVYDVLLEKGVKEIHHANSILTACQFLRRGALLSRGSTERAKLHQTAQASDKLDQKFSLWYDVFTDSVDIHARAKRENAYGPVLFVLDSAMIKEKYTGDVWVTKLNPTKWEGVSEKERWFTSIQDLRDNFVKGRFDQMIVFRHNGGVLPFEGHLKEIIVDDPDYRGERNQLDLYSMALGALLLARTEGNMNLKIRKRKCQSGCKCLEHYKNDKTKMGEMFLPRV
jgi:hypothetical protein